MIDGTASTVLLQGPELVLPVYTANRGEMGATPWATFGVPDDLPYPRVSGYRIALLMVRASGTGGSAFLQADADSPLTIQITDEGPTGA